MAQDALATLLDIPAFLVAGSPERAEALERGAAWRAAHPLASKSNGTQVINRIAPTKREKKTTKRNIDAEVRRALLKADFTPGFVARCPITKARKILVNLAAGLGAEREDLI